MKKLLSSNKITISEFCEKTGKSRKQVYRLFAHHPNLKVKIPGESECRVNMDVWEEILRKA